jgi:hypothetical protein
MRRTALGLILTLVLGAAPFAAPTASGQGCPSTPTYDPAITSPEVAIPGFPDRLATTIEINNYFNMVDSQTNRVSTDTFATSWNGTQMVYSFVGEPADVADPARVAADQNRLKDPRVTTPDQAAQLASSIPAIAWYTANVHGGETSGADAAITMLYELAARTDCEVASIRDNLLVGIIPTQNPDGRDLQQRTNVYNFDMNRDWYAKTQPETAGKLALLAKYPPSVVFVDAHEMGGNSFFFPPNSDPIYHEISAQSIDWIDNVYGAAMAQAFQQRGFDFFNGDIYDLFYMGYGDSVPTTAYTTAGMTFEKGTLDSFRQRWLEQFTAGWATIKAAAANKTEILNEYYQAYSDALQQGAEGLLEPNQVYRPGNTVLRPVPDMRVRHYFFSQDHAYPYVARMVDRLLTFGVEVYQLTADVQVNDLHEYGRAPSPGVVKRGSYWIPMNQPQKRWIQAVMHEDTYVPYPYFYDVTAWSNPLVLHLDATFTGDALSSVPALRVSRAPTGGVGTSRRPGSSPLFYWWPGDTGMTVAAALALERAGIQVRRLLDEATVAGNTLPKGAFVVPPAVGIVPTLKSVAQKFAVRMHASLGAPPSGVELRSPKVGVYEAVPNEESFGHLRWLLQRSWEIPFDRLTAAQIEGGILTAMDYDVLIVPGTSTADLTGARTQIDQWIQAGGIYVGTTRPGNTGGTPFAIGSGWSTATATTVAGLQVPGTLFRVAPNEFDSSAGAPINNRSPVTLAAEHFAYWFHRGERKLNLSTTGANAVLFPTSEPDFFISGYAEGHAPLKGSAGLVDETRGSGRVILFSNEPNYRGYTEVSAFFLANTLVYPLGAAPATVNTASPEAAAAVAAAAASVGPETGPGRPIRIEVPAAEASAALAVLHGFTPNVQVEEARGSAFLEIANPRDFDVEEHPFSMEILPALKAAGVTVRSAIL